MKQRVLILIWGIAVLCFTGTGNAMAGEDFAGRLPSETSLDRSPSGTGDAGGVLRAPGGSGDIDTGSETGEEDESGTRNDAPAGEAMAALALTGIVYGLVRRVRISKEKQLKAHTKH